MVGKRNLSSLDVNINIIHVDEKFLACESVLVKENLKLIGINGRPIFNCSQSCKMFLLISLSQTKGKIKKPNIVIKNLEVINKGCSTPVVKILKAMWIELDNAVFRESEHPVILISQQNWKPMNIIVHNSSFLSAYGIKAFQYTWLFLTIEKSQFLGNGRHIARGIIINEDGSNRSRCKLELIVKSTTFKDLVGAVNIQTSGSSFNISFENSSFVGNYLMRDSLSLNQLLRKPGGAFRMFVLPCKFVRKQMPVRFNDVVFRNNTAVAGGAVYIAASLHVERKLRIKLHKCQFIANQAAVGGAITVVNPSKFYYDKPIVGSLFLHKCSFENNKATCKAFRFAIQIAERTGGGISCGYFEVYIANTTMINNYADSYGGSLQNVGCNIHLINTTIRIDERMPHTPIDGHAINQKGFQIMRHVRIEMNKRITIQNSETSYTWFSGLQNGKNVVPFTVPHRVSLICPNGNDIDLIVRVFHQLYRPNIKTFTKVLFRCLPCPKQFYSLDQGRALLLNLSSRATHHINCISCPYGGDCSRGIKAKANFWGFRSEGGGVSTIKFLPCPKGYCCQGKTCVTFDSCNKNREGILCGQCREGFVQELISSNCIKESNCGNPVIWPLIVFLAAVYLLLFMYISELAASLKKLIPWNKTVSNNTVTDDTQKMGHRTHRKNACKGGHYSSLMKIIFFFGQIEPLIRINQNTSHKSYFFDVTKSLRSFYTDLLNFKLSISCPFKNISPVLNQALAGAFPILLIILLGVFNIFYSISIHFRRSVLKRNEDQLNNPVSSFKARLVSCLVNVILLSYASITKTTLALLNCVEINEIRVLYLDGTVICYKTWQYILMAFVAIFILPLPISLTFAARKLKRRELSVRHFLLLLFLPILSIVRAIGHCIRSSKISTEGRKKKGNRHHSLRTDPCSELNLPLLEFLSDSQEFEMISEVQEESHQVAGLRFEESETLHELPQPHNYSQMTSEVDADESQQSSEQSPCQNITQENVCTTGNQDYTSTNKEMYLQAVLSVIDNPFSSKQGKYEINWESMLIARRLILILLFTFVPYPTLRLTLMLFTCLLMIIHSVYVNPYPSKFVSRSEIVSLFILVILCFINGLVAFSHETNAYLKGYLKYSPDVFSWMEVILVDVIPAIILLVISALIILRLLQMLFKLILNGIRFLTQKCHKA